MFKYVSKVGGVIGYIIQYGCIAHCTFEYIGDFVICSGPSMEPTLYTNNILVTDRLTPRIGNIDRGDIIIAVCPTTPTTNICKRVVGLPGDKILLKPRFNPFGGSSKSINSGIDGVDDRPALENEQPHFSNQELSKKTFKSSVITVPRGHVWLEGDNFENSTDSRKYGSVPLGLIKGRVTMLRLWPLNDFKLFI